MRGWSFYACSPRLRRWGSALALLVAPLVSAPPARGLDAGAPHAEEVDAGSAIADGATDADAVEGSSADAAHVCDATSVDACSVTLWGHATASTSAPHPDAGLNVPPDTQASAQIEDARGAAAIAPTVPPPVDSIKLGPVPTTPPEATARRQANARKKPGPAIEVTVAAKRRMRVPFVREATVPIAVVDGQDARKVGAKNAGEALLEVPGLLVTGPHNQVDRFSEVRIRGFDPQYTLVLVDGERVADGPSEGRFDFASIGIDQIDRIEVVKGPQALSYGSDAIGGVVNIQTRAPSDTLRLKLNAGYGSLRTLRAAASAEGGLTRSTRVRVFARHERSAGFTDAHDLDRALRQTTPRDDRRPTQRTEAQTELWQELGRHVTLRATGRVHVQRAFVERTSRRYVETGREDGEDDRRDYSGTLRADIRGPRAGRGVASLRFSRGDLDRHRDADLVHSGEGRFLYREVSSEVQSIHDTLWGARVHWTQPWLESQLLSIYGEGRYRVRSSGNDGRIQRYDDDDILIRDTRALRPERQYRKDERYLVAGLENESRFRAHAFTVGVRIEDTATWAPAVTPASSLRFTLPQGFDLRLSLGMGYRVPNFELRTESPVPQLDLLGQRYTAGNPDLRPERSLAAQTLVTHYWNERLSWGVAFHATGMQDRIERAIQDDFMGTGLPLERSVNIGRALTAGTEIDLRYQPFRDFGVRGSYAYLFTRNFEHGGRLNEVPNHTASLALVGTVPRMKLDLSTSYLYVGARPRVDALSGLERIDSPVGAMHLLRARASQRLPLGFRLELDIENAANVQWDRDNDGDSDMPPIRFFASASWTMQ